ncbi:MAG: ribosome small subunit-dependent GTPase A [Thermoguttaceae bacterium]|nr:ribosome small subunit-dependent GTPase A [Thermoguttaceae bacterium]
MSKKGKKDSSRKLRVEFKRNRSSRTREKDWTQRYRGGSASAESSPESEDALSGERVSGKGDLVRKRTVVGSVLPTENASGERGDFRVLPDVSARPTLPGRVVAVYGLYSRVEEEETGRIYTCATRRILKTLSTEQRQVVIVGDRVRFRAASDDEGIIERIEPRFGSLSRTSRGRKHVLVTNVDQALIVASAAEPGIKPNLIDRLLVTCGRAGIAPVILVNKFDLVDPAELMPLFGVYAQMGYKVIPTSVKTGYGIARVRRLLAGRESVVVGQSGVGKSSLLNEIEPGLDLRTAEVSLENQKGRHTTTSAELLRLSFGGYVVDTPGIRQFMLWDIISEEVMAYFRDLCPYENLCKFSDCTHTHENGCAVKDAVADGRVDARRYASYLSIRAGEMVDD